jgi:hypothetical protein
VRFQSPSSTTQALHHALTERLGSHRCHPAACYDLPRRTLLCLGHALWLELLAIQGGCPPGYRVRQVSPCDPCRITTTSAAHHRGTRLTLPSQPCPGFSPVRHVQGCPGYPGARFDVAQHQQLSFDAEAIEGGSLTPPRRSYAAPALLAARGFRQCPRARLTTVEAGFPAGVGLGGAQSGVTVCVCGGWLPPHSDPPGVCGVASPFVCVTSPLFWADMRLHSR